ncbi:hypothetical protein [Fluviicola taffensis]|uniref:Lipoprotein n=1 Tax=Fluviicola taffensis (strain DSM 16823 / NCIMB 13979 / RW262) TaxID=755732 RepID=F2IFE1_FLUTR|nr:hypothetical protein [Fluviicola taffensis]AEA44626.1 hypothetical protein Fluta_2644 [Fluviicola taffensis DSM 16823]
MNPLKSNFYGIIIGLITALLMSCNESKSTTKENTKEYKRALQKLKNTDSIKPEPLDTSSSEEMNALKKQLKEDQYGEWPIPNTVK